MGCPVICLSLGMMTHLAVRFLAAEMGVSDPIIPQRSILVGRGQSVAWTRVLLRDLLHQAHHRFLRFSIRTWVDDLRTRMVGSSRSIVEDSPEAM
eukprot:3715283-Pyramimonas_sp.AAC.1